LKYFTVVQASVHSGDILQGTYSGSTIADYNKLHITHSILGLGHNMGHSPMIIGGQRGQKAAQKNLIIKFQAMALSHNFQGKTV